VWILAAQCNFGPHNAVPGGQRRAGYVDRVSAAAAPLSDVFRVLDLIGVFTSAALGAVIARSARLDLVGLTVIALLSGLGGIPTLHYGPGDAKLAHGCITVAQVSGHPAAAYPCVGERRIERQCALEPRVGFFEPMQ